MKNSINKPFYYYHDIPNKERLEWYLNELNYPKKQRFDQSECNANESENTTSSTHFFDVILTDFNTSEDGKLATEHQGVYQFWYDLNEGLKYLEEHHLVHELNEAFPEYLHAYDYTDYQNLTELPVSKVPLDDLMDFLKRYGFQSEPLEIN